MALINLEGESAKMCTIDSRVLCFFNNMLCFLYSIHAKVGARPQLGHQRRFNLAIREVVRKQVLKWLDHGIIYPFFYSEWVSPVQVITKKTSVTMIRNDKNKLITT